MKESRAARSVVNGILDIPTGSLYHYEIRCLNMLAAVLFIFLLFRPFHSRAMLAFFSFFMVTFTCSRRASYNKTGWYFVSDIFFKKMVKNKQQLIFTKKNIYFNIHLPNIYR